MIPCLSRISHWKITQIFFYHFPTADAPLIPAQGYSRRPFDPYAEGYTERQQNQQSCEMQMRYPAASAPKDW